MSVNLILLVILIIVLFFSAKISEKVKNSSPKKLTYDDAILAQFVVHHATDSNRTVRVECLRCQYTCQIFKCLFAVGQLLVNCWYTASLQYADRLLGELFFTFTKISVVCARQRLNLCRLLCWLSCIWLSFKLNAWANFLLFRYTVLTVCFWKAVCFHKLLYHQKTTKDKKGQ